MPTSPQHERLPSAEPASAAVAALRRFTSRQVTPQEICEVCGRGIAPNHQHLIDPTKRRLVCACDACAILFDNSTATFRRVPRTVRRLPTPAFTDAQWEALSIPIGMAFFFVSSALDRVVAMYPGPAGAAESLLPLGAWDEMVPADSPVRSMKPDAEALLVNRVPRQRARADGTSGSDAWRASSDYLVPIDQCYRLVGLIRAEWKGFGGGTEAWEAIERFYADLDARAEPVGDGHA